jgi:hypothetical protein
MNITVFAIDDMTGDGIPELFVGSNFGTYGEWYALYTYKNNKVVSLFKMNENEGTYAVLYNKKKHYFIIQGPPTPSCYYVVYQYQSGKLKKIYEYDGYNGDYSKCEKYIENAVYPNYIKITEENLK